MLIMMHTQLFTFVGVAIVAAVACLVTDGVESFTVPRPSTSSSLIIMAGKKSKRKGGGGGGGGGGGKAKFQQKQEKQAVQDQRFDAATRQFMFTLTGLSKTLPDKSKTILDNIHLSFYPGAKIGIVGLNGSGYVRWWRNSYWIYVLDWNHNSSDCYHRFRFLFFFWFFFLFLRLRIHANFESNTNKSQPLIAITITTTENPHY